jgi:hypothetical protein
MLAAARNEQVQLIAIRPGNANDGQAKAKQTKQRQ